jgi:hypothetical protein
VDRRFVGNIVTPIWKSPPTESAPGPLLTAVGQLFRLRLGVEELLAGSGGEACCGVGTEDGGVRHIDVGLHGEQGGEGLIAQLAGILVVLLTLQCKDI